jgi:hypothetical protein
MDASGYARTLWYFHDNAAPGSGLPLPVDVCARSHVFCPGQTILTLSTRLCHPLAWPQIEADNAARWNHNKKIASS